MTKTSFQDPTYSQKHFVFDVESIGIHGEPFAVAFVVFDEHQVYEEKTYACKRELARGDLSDHKWVKENVPEIEVNMESPLAVREAFWKKLIYWDEAFIWAHHMWPVDVGIITRCVQDRPVERKWKAPHPIHEICTLAEFVLGNQWPPMLPSEQPQHHPLNDTRYSVRVLKQCLNKL